MRKNGLGSDWGSRKYKHLPPSARKALRKNIETVDKKKILAHLEGDVLVACDRLKLFGDTTKLIKLLAEFMDGTRMIVAPELGLMLVQKAIMAHRLASEMFEDARRGNEA